MKYTNPVCWHKLLHTKVNWPLSENLCVRNRALSFRGGNYKFLGRDQVTMALFLNQIVTSCTDFSDAIEQEQDMH